MTQPNFGTAQQPLTSSIEYLDEEQAVPLMEAVALNYANTADLNLGGAQAHPNRSDPGAGMHERQSTPDILAGTTPYMAYHEFQVQLPIPRSNSADTPIKAVVACNRCSIKKRKCDEQRPKCSRCQKSGKKCIYGKDGRVKKVRSASQLEREINLEAEKRQCKIPPTVSIVDSSPCIMVYPNDQGEVTKRIDNQPESEAVLVNHVGTGSNPWIINLDLSKKQIVMKFYNTQQLCEIYAYCERLLSRQ